MATTREDRLWCHVEEALADAPAVTTWLREIWPNQTGLRSGLLVWLSGESAQAEEKTLGIASAAMELLGLSLRLPHVLPVRSSFNPVEQFRMSEYLFARGMRLALELPLLVACEIADEACRSKFDSLRRMDQSSPEPSILENAYMQSGRWNAICCKIGGGLGNGSDRIQEALTEYGFALGMALATEDPMYQKRAAACLSSLPDSPAKRLLVKAAFRIFSGKGRSFLDV